MCSEIVVLFFGRCSDEYLHSLAAILRFVLMLRFNHVTFTRIHLHQIAMTFESTIITNSNDRI